MPRQTSIQLTEATERQVQALKKAGWGNFTAIVRVAVDRLYQQEVGKMYIKVEFSEESLFYRMDSDTLAQYDVPASMDRYVEHLTNYIYDEYPQAEIEIIQSDRERIMVDGDPDHDEVRWIKQLIDTVYNDADWEVERMQAE